MITALPLEIPSRNSCTASDTVVNGKAACRGEVVFEDSFRGPLSDKWKHIVMIPDTPVSCWSKIDRTAFSPSLRKCVKEYMENISGTEFTQYCYLGHTYFNATAGKND